MQNRYTGDIGDFGKLGLLRQLSRTGLSIGVNWYLTPDETHNGDGRHIGYLKNDAFRACDEQLWSVLGQIVGSGKRQVSALERPDILQASFYSRVLDFTGADKTERQMLRWEWHNRAMQQLQNCDIIFVDMPAFNPFQPADMDYLISYTQTADALPVLVMPAGIDADEAAETAESFAQAGALYLLATRLDAARRFGGILAAADAGGLRVCEASMSQSLSKGLSPINAVSLARLLLTSAESDPERTES